MSGTKRTSARQTSASPWREPRWVSNKKHAAFKTFFVQVIDYTLGLWVDAATLTVAKPNARRANFFAYFAIFSLNVSRSFNNDFFRSGFTCRSFDSGIGVDCHRGLHRLPCGRDLPGGPSRYRQDPPARRSGEIRSSQRTGSGPDHFHAERLWVQANITYPDNGWQE